MVELGMYLLLTSYLGFTSALPLPRVQYPTIICVESTLSN